MKLSYDPDDDYHPYFYDVMCGVNRYNFKNGAEKQIQAQCIDSSNPRVVIVGLCELGLVTNIEINILLYVFFITKKLKLIN